MSKFHVKLSARAKEGAGNNVAMFDAMYADREKLETIFRFFDTDNNGSISREEFHKVSGGVGHIGTCSLFLVHFVRKFGMSGVLGAVCLSRSSLCSARRSRGEVNAHICPLFVFIFGGQGCELINQQADDGEYLENIDVILGVMDMDNNDSIDINEFFEVMVDR